MEAYKENVDEEDAVKDDAEDNNDNGGKPSRRGMCFGGCVPCGGPLRKVGWG